MIQIKYLCICFVWLNWVAAIEFSRFLNDGVYCKDTGSFVLQDNNRTLKVTLCEEPLPMKPAVNSVNITQFTLQYNEIKRLTQKQFQNLPSLNQLSFFNNNVRQMDENTLEGLKFLTNLTIIEPVLTIEDLRLSRECKLEQLNLRLKLFDSEKLLTNLPKDITNITIEDTPEVNSVISLPDHLVNLKYLRFKNCSIVSIKAPSVALIALEFLDLSHNKIEEKTWTWLKYPNLITLILSYNIITSIDENDFKDLKSLKVLQLNNNSIENVGFNVFRTNLDLKRVDLSHNYIKSIQLNYTEFHNYSVQAACNPMLTEFLPETIFYFNTTNHIDCIGNSQKVPTKSNNWPILLVVLFTGVLFISICSIIFIQWRKRKILLKNLNEMKKYVASNENLSQTGVPPPFVDCGSEDCDSNQSNSNMKQDAQPASSPTRLLSLNNVTKDSESDDNVSGPPDSESSDIDEHKTVFFQNVESFLLDYQEPTNQKRIKVRTKPYGAPKAVQHVNSK